MFRQFEYSKDPKNSYEDNRDAFFRAFTVSLRVLSDKNKKVGNYRHHVEYVHQVPTKAEL